MISEEIENKYNGVYEIISNPKNYNKEYSDDVEFTVSSFKELFYQLYLGRCSLTKTKKNMEIIKSRTVRYLDIENRTEFYLATVGANYNIDVTYYPMNMNDSSQVAFASQIHEKFTPIIDDFLDLIWDEKHKVGVKKANYELEFHDGEIDVELHVKKFLKHKSRIRKIESII
jgi:hypothetical protein